MRGLFSPHVAGEPRRETRRAPWPSRNKCIGRAAESRHFDPFGQAAAHQGGRAAHRRLFRAGPSPRRQMRSSRLFTLSRDAPRRRAAGGYNRAMTRMNHARTRIFAHPTRRGFLGLAAGCTRRAIFGEGARPDRRTRRAIARRRLGGDCRPAASPGVIAIRSLELPPGARLIGAAGGSTLKLIGPGPLLHATGSSGVTLESIVFDGGDNMVEAKRGLLDFEDAAGLSIRGCAIKNSSCARRQSHTLRRGCRAK